MKKFLSFIALLAILTGVMSVSVSAKTQQEAVDWAKAQIGKSIDYDGAYGAQCVDLIKAYYNWLGVTPSSGNGKDYASNTLPSGWQRHTNTASFLPKGGDIAVWNSNVGGGYGHVGIVSSADLKNFYSIDQNWSTYSANGGAGALELHNYNNVVCFIRPSFQSEEAEGIYTSASEGVYTPASGTIVSMASGTYNFKCVDGGRYLNVYAGTDKDGANVCVWEKDGSKEQNYTLEDRGSKKYFLKPQSSGSRVIDVNRGSSYSNPLKAGLNIDIWQTNDIPAQEFYILDVGNGNYTIELAALRGHVLSVSNPGANNGNVSLERYTGGKNQMWRIIRNGNDIAETAQPTGESNTTSTTKTKAYANPGLGNNLNLRSDANASSNVVAIIPHGTLVYINRNVILNGFYPTDYNGMKGYASAQFVSLTQPSISASNAPNPAFASMSCDNITVKEGESVNFWWDNAANTTGYEIHIMFNGSLDRTDKVTGNTHKITFPKAGIYEIIIYSTNANTQTKGNSINIKVEPKFNEITAYANPGVGNNLNIRSGATTSADNVIIKAPHGAVLTITNAVVSGFHPVLYNGTHGYASTQYVTTTKPNDPSKATEKIAYANPGAGYNLNIREGTGTNTNVLTKVPHGALLTITGDATSGFYPVRYNGANGYASTRYVSMTKPSNGNTGGSSTDGNNFVNPIKIGYTITTRFATHLSYSPDGGIDLACPTGTAIYASKGGKVIFAGWGGLYGNLIKIDNGDGFITWYAHCNSIDVSAGQSVSQNQKIGTVGSTGNSSGPHLHFAITQNGVAKNPENYVKF